MIESIKETSIESIRSRMIRNAARIWGIEDEDVESSFDPLVTMLIEACAFELNRINDDILDSRSRVLELLARLLSPDIYTGPQPAFAIAHARASEGYIVMNEETQFYSSTKSLGIDQKEKTDENYFSPVNATLISDAAVRFVAVGDTLFEYKSPISKQVVEGGRLNPLSNGEMWIGLEVGSSLKNLKDCAFFFDWRIEPEKEKYLKSLQFANWFYQGNELEIVPGLKLSESQHTMSDLSKTYDNSIRIRKAVNMHCAKHFVTVKGKIPLLPENEGVPQSLKEALPETIQRAVTGHIHWLKVVFPGTIRQSALADMYVSLNAFPVINRKLNKLTYQLRKSTNFIPLSSGEQFLDVLDVQNSNGEFYASSPLEGERPDQGGFYSLKYGGVERFDARSAKEHIGKLVDLLRDESAAFSSMGVDFLSNYIGQIEQSLSTIENRLNTKGVGANPSHFLIARPTQVNETVYVRFWSTDGSKGNNVKAGTKLNSLTGAEMKSGSTLLLTSTSGGKDPLGETEKINAYRKSVLTKDRVVSKEDVIAFCYFELGDLIKRVDVTKGWQISDVPSEGAIRVVEVTIELADRSTSNITKWQTTSKQLEEQLYHASNEMIPFHVTINTNGRKGSN